MSRILSRFVCRFAFQLFGIAFGYWRVGKEVLKYFDKFRTCVSKLTQVIEREFLQKSLTIAGQLYEYVTAVVRAAQPADETAINQTIDELHSTMVL